jgi:hypothetical protein
MVTPWLKKELALIGKLPDIEVARRISRNYKAIAEKRKSLGIRYRAKVIRYWTKAEERTLGTDVDSVVARKLNGTVHGVFMRRRKLGISNGNPKRRRWKACEDKSSVQIRDSVLKNGLNSSIKYFIIGAEGFVSSLCLSFDLVNLTTCFSSA